MYGVCHKGVEEFVIEAFGQETWDKAKKQARIDGEIQLDAYYEDSMSTRVFDSIIEQFPGTDMDGLLFQFGEFWVRYARDTSLKSLLADTTDLVEMLDSLNEMHGRMKLLLPQMRPPVFEVVVKSDTELDLHYRSERVGLAPMVVGLIKELGVTFNETTKVEHVISKDNGQADHDVFSILHYPKNESAMAAE